MVLHYPQLTLSFCDEPGIVTYNNHSWTRMESMLVMSSKPVHRCLNKWETALPVTRTLASLFRHQSLTTCSICLYRAFTHFQHRASSEHSRIVLPNCSLSQIKLQLNAFPLRKVSMKCEEWQITNLMQFWQKILWVIHIKITRHLVIVSQNHFTSILAYYCKIRA